MTRVLLINPPSPERLGAPLLGFQYVAAALLARGCEVKVIDAAARYFHPDAEWITREAAAFRPSIIGFALFTRWVWHAYRLVEQLALPEALIVAGGAHATARPEEPLRHGFHIALAGEAEQSITRIVDFVELGTPLSSIPGIYFRNRDGSIGTGPPASFIDNLDTLAFPQEAQKLFDPAWYHPEGAVTVPGGVMTSRGCPARCTFCANYVTGRGFRYRSSGNVIAELSQYNRRFDSVFFPFWDDALTANIARLKDLCNAFLRDLSFPVRWSAITRANMVNPELLRLMKQAGCVAVNFGVESGDDEVLKIIKKGVSTAHVVRALEWAKAEGLMTAANFMLGFPEETPAALERTLRFMERIAPLVDSFSTLGVAVPFPCTPLYEDNHARYGFTDWWLREEYSHYSAAPPIDETARFYRHYIDDANLDLDFFHYPDEVRGLIRLCLKYKGERNLLKMGLLRDPVYRPEPARFPSELHQSGPQVARWEL